jgi:hypothetical protein
MVQVIHRARLSLLREQSPLGGHADDGDRSTVRLVLHTSHPVPGLRVDELRLNSIRQDRNEQRRAEAETRILNAAAELQREGQALSARAVARRAGSHPRTVAAVLGTVIHTPKEDLLYRGVTHLPQSSEPNPSSGSPTRTESAADGLCLGGCGKPMPPGQKCQDCAMRSVDDWTRRRRGARALRAASKVATA